MPPELSEPLLSRLSQFLADGMGLYFPRERWRDLERGIRSAAREFGAADAESCAQWLLSAPLTRRQTEILASELTVGETYFFRENRSFEILRDHILPEMIRTRQGTGRRLRIWSAGCCTGEEAYSIAILLDRMLLEPREWHVTILATDINPRFLQKAVEGVYSEWSFRNPPPWLKGTYFTPVAGRRYEISQRIRDKVTFAYLNLAEDAYPSLFNNTNAMDVIFCRNVLMYFDAEHVRKVVRNFRHSLLEGGWLAVSPTEASPQIFAPFETVHFDGATLYRKSGSRAATPAIFFPEKAPAAAAIPAVDIPAPPAREPFIFPEIAPANEPARAVEATPSIYAQAQALFEKGQYLEAAAKLKTETGFETKAESLTLLARICANLGQLGEALQWAEKAISTDKLNAGARYLRAVILQEQGAAEDSIAAFEKALYLDPDLVLAHFALGNLASRRGSLEEAERHFSNALRLLKRYGADDVLPHSDGLAAGRLEDMVRSMMPAHTIA